jgi:hypothetical protein
MQIKTLCYYIVSFLPGVVFSGKGTIFQVSQKSFPAATLSIHKNKTPTVWIFTPELQEDHLAVFGYAEDEEDGSLPNQSYCWKVELYHRKRAIQTSTIQSTKSLTLEISRKKRHRSHDWYRVHLSISDTNGNIGKDSVDLYLN